MIKHKTNPLIAAFLAFCLTMPCWAREVQLRPQDLASLSLEELLEVKIASPAALTSLKTSETPASVTTITRKEILLTPARNLYDLMEIYVPGAIWLNYEEGPMLGIRGLISNRNSKFLLALNGHVISGKGGYGARTELEQWDLFDIEKVDIIRGPGSVTYGPGGVAGIIDITTRTAPSSAPFQIKTRYITEYQSKGVYTNYALSLPQIDLFFHAGVTATPGYMPREFQGTNDNQPGYIGLTTQFDYEPLDYFADTPEQPQAKLFLDTKLWQNWHFTLRYTQDGSTWHGNETKEMYEGRLTNIQLNRSRQFLGLLSYRNSLTEKLDWNTRISANFFDVERRGGSLRAPNIDSYQNFKYNSSETMYTLYSVINFHPTSSAEFALGGEFTLDSLGPGWGDPKSSLKMGNDGVIVSDSASKVFPGGLDLEDAIFIGSGLTTHSTSFFTELKLMFWDRLTLLTSSRIDNHTFTNWLFSPRMALIYAPSPQYTSKGILQKSVRMNGITELYIENSQGTPPATESLNFLEWIQIWRPREPLALTLSAFYTEGILLGWNPDIDKSVEIGNLELWGLETELRWKKGRFLFGANYSLIEQLDWKLLGGNTSSGVSYADYNQPLKNSNALQKGLGNSLNNWPNQALKLFSSRALGPKLQIHANLQLLWDYQGAKDGLFALENAVMQDTALAHEFKEGLQTVYDEDIFDLSTRLNLSAEYSPFKNFSATIYIFNLLGPGSNKRYSYDIGADRPSPHRVRFIQENRALGVNLNYILP